MTPEPRGPPSPDESQALPHIGGKRQGKRISQRGQGKRLENGKLATLDVKAGDRILFGKYSGSEIKLDGNDYLILREDEVLGILEGAAKPAKVA